MKPLISFLRREYRAFGCAVAGLACFFRSGPHARFHALAAAAVLVLCVLLPVSRTELLLLLLCMALVIITEVINTCLEQLLDLVHKNHHPLIGRIKDMAAGSVLIASVCSVIAAGVIFLPKIL